MNLRFHHTKRTRYALELVMQQQALILRTPVRTPNEGLTLRACMRLSATPRLLTSDSQMRSVVYKRSVIVQSPSLCVSHVATAAGSFAPDFQVQSRVAENSTRLQRARVLG